MEQIPDTNVPQKNRRVFWIFYIAALFLLIGVITASFAKRQCWSAGARANAQQIQRQNDIKEQRESIPTVIAAAEIDVQQLSRYAEYWRKTSVVFLALAILSLGIVRRHYEKQRWVGVPVIVLFAFYILVEVFLL